MWKKIKSVLRLICPKRIRWLIMYSKIEGRDKMFRLHHEAFVHNTKLGKWVAINGEAQISHSIIGDCSYVAGNGTIISNTTIGKFCSIGPHTMMGCGTHPTSKFVSTSPVFFSTLEQCPIHFADKCYFEELKPITIGNDVWIGANVFICDGITIGDGAIIAAGAVVAKNVPPYAIVGGVPAKIIRKRFTDDHINFLLKDKWWDKNINWLKENYILLHDIDVYMDICK